MRATKLLLQVLHSGLAGFLEALGFVGCKLQATISRGDGYSSIALRIPEGMSVSRAGQPSHEELCLLPGSWV